MFFQSISKPTWLIAMLVLASVAIHGVNVDGDVGWGGGDWATYIWGAENLLGARPWGEAPYLVNPFKDAGVTKVPPLYPAVLTLPVSIFGRDFLAIGLFNVVLFGLGLATLLVFARHRPLAGERMSNFALGALCLAYAGSPMLWRWSGALFSENLFLPIIFLAFIAWDRFAKRRTKASLLLVFVFCALAIATRVVGIALIPALGLALLAQDRALTLRAVALPAALLLVGLLVFLSFGVLDQYLTVFSSNAALDSGAELTAPDVRSAGGTVTSILGELPSKLADVPGKLSAFWSDRLGGASPAIKLGARFITLLVLLLSTIGFMVSLVRRTSLAEGFMIGYLAMMLIVPGAMNGARMYGPIGALMMYYTVAALQWLGEQQQRFTPVHTPLVVFIVLLLGSYAYFFAQERPSNLASPYSPSAQTFFEFVKDNTDANDILVGHRPRGVGFFTGVTCIEWHTKTASDDFVMWMADLGAEYLYVDRYSAPLEKIMNEKSGSFRDAADAYIAPNAHRFDRIFANDRFVMYRFISSPASR
ncbi:MAG: glycosyltransferase family 39 protein [Pseudomonadota bacterium]